LAVDVGPQVEQDALAQPGQQVGLAEAQQEGGEADAEVERGDAQQPAPAAGQIERARDQELVRRVAHQQRQQVGQAGQGQHDDHAQRHPARVGADIVQHAPHQGAVEQLAGDV
jgi:hypothetical protein